MRTDPHAWWLRCHDRETWLEVYKTLVNHTKIDVNARRTWEQVQAMRQTWSFVPEDERPPNLPTVEHDPNADIWDDQMTAWDYLFQNSTNDDDAATKKFAADLARILAQSGKLDVKHITCNRKPNDGDLQHLGSLVKGAYLIYQRDKHFGPLDALLERVAYFPQARALLAELTAHGGTDEPAAERIQEGIKRTRRALLPRWRRAARLSTLLARWWADARATAYAPDGAGAQRARSSFEATTAAAGW